jgi:hypothetical protein
MEFNTEYRHRNGDQEAVWSMILSMVWPSLLRSRSNAFFCVNAKSQLQYGAFVLRWSELQEVSAAFLSLYAQAGGPGKVFSFMLDDLPGSALKG